MTSITISRRSGVKSNRNWRVPVVRRNAQAVRLDIEMRIQKQITDPPSKRRVIHSRRKKHSVQCPCRMCQNDQMDNLEFAKKRQLKITQQLEGSKDPGSSLVGPAPKTNIPFVAYRSLVPKPVRPQPLLGLPPSNHSSAVSSSRPHGHSHAGPYPTKVKTSGRKPVMQKTDVLSVSSSSQEVMTAPSSTNPNQTDPVQTGSKINATQPVTSIQNDTKSDVASDGSISSSSSSASSTSAGKSTQMPGTLRPWSVQTEQDSLSSSSSSSSKATQKTRGKKQSKQKSSSLSSEKQLQLTVAQSNALGRNRKETGYSAGLTNVVEESTKSMAPADAVEASKLETPRQQQTTHQQQQQFQQQISSKNNDYHDHLSRPEKSDSVEKRITESRPKCKKSKKKSKIKSQYAFKPPVDTMAAHRVLRGKGRYEETVELKDTYRIYPDLALLSPVAASRIRIRSPSYDHQVDSQTDPASTTATTTTMTTAGPVKLYDRFNEFGFARPGLNQSSSSPALVMLDRNAPSPYNFGYDTRTDSGYQDLYPADEVKQRRTKRIPHEPFPHDIFTGTFITPSTTARSSRPPSAVTTDRAGFVRSQSEFNNRKTLSTAPSLQAAASSSQLLNRNFTSTSQAISMQHSSSAASFPQHSSRPSSSGSSYLSARFANRPKTQEQIQHTAQFQELLDDDQFDPYQDPSLLQRHLQAQYTELKTQHRDNKREHRRLIAEHLHPSLRYKHRKSLNARDKNSKKKQSKRKQMSGIQKLAKVLRVKISSRALVQHSQTIAMDAPASSYGANVLLGKLPAQHKRHRLRLEDLLGPPSLSRLKTPTVSDLHRGVNDGGRALLDDRYLYPNQFHAPGHEALVQGLRGEANPNQSAPFTIQKATSNDNDNYNSGQDPNSFDSAQPQVDLSETFTGTTLQSQYPYFASHLDVSASKTAGANQIGSKPQTPVSHLYFNTTKVSRAAGLAAQKLTQTDASREIYDTYVTTMDYRTHGSPSTQDVTNPLQMTDTRAGPPRYSTNTTSSSSSSSSYIAATASPFSSAAVSNCQRLMNSNQAAKAHGPQVKAKSGSDRDSKSRRSSNSTSSKPHKKHANSSNKRDVDANFVVSGKSKVGRRANGETSVVSPSTNTNTLEVAQDTNSAVGPSPWSPPKHDQGLGMLADTDLPPAPASDHNHIIKAKKKKESPSSTNSQTKADNTNKSIVVGGASASSSFASSVFSPSSPFATASFDNLRSSSQDKKQQVEKELVANDRLVTKPIPKSQHDPDDDLMY